MTYKSKNAQVMLKDLCMKPGEFFMKKNNSEACSSFNIDLRKVRVTIKIFQHDSLLLNKCNHGIFCAKLNVPWQSMTLKSRKMRKSAILKGFNPLY